MARVFSQRFFPVSAMPKRFCFALAALCLGVSTLNAQHVLQWKFRAGERLHYTFTRDQTVKRTADGENTQESARTTTDMTLVVDQVAADRAAQLTLVFNRIQYQNKTSNSEIQYDSKSDEAPRGVESKLAAKFKKLLGSEFSFKMTPRGEITDIREAERGTPKNANAPSKSSSLLTAKAIKNLLPYLLLPQEPVGAGRTWQEQTDYSEPARGIR